MKQACRAREGVSRREREKRCGRNVGGRGKLVTKWTSRAGVAKGRETLKEALGALGYRAGEKQQYSEEEVKLTRG
jgi:hypothetical protein